MVVIGQSTGACEHPGTGCGMSLNNTGVTLIPLLTTASLLPVKLEKDKAVANNTKAVQNTFFILANLLILF